MDLAATCEVCGAGEAPVQEAGPVCRVPDFGGVAKGEVPAEGRFAVPVARSLRTASSFPDRARGWRHAAMSPFGRVAANTNRRRSSPRRTKRTTRGDIGPDRSLEAHPGFVGFALVPRVGLRPTRGYWLKPLPGFSRGSGDRSQSERQALDARKAVRSRLRVDLLVVLRDHAVGVEEGDDLVHRVQHQLPPAFGIIVVERQGFLFHRLVEAEQVVAVAGFG